MGSCLDTENAVVPESTIFKALWKIVGAAREWDVPAKAAFCGHQEKLHGLGSSKRGGKKRKKYLRLS